MLPCMQAGGGRSMSGPGGWSLSSHGSSSAGGSNGGGGGGGGGRPRRPGAWALSPHTPLSSLCQTPFLLTPDAKSRILQVSCPQSTLPVTVTADAHQVLIERHWKASWQSVARRQCLQPLVAGAVRLFLTGPAPPTAIPPHHTLHPPPHTLHPLSTPPTTTTRARRSSRRRRR